MVSLPAQIYSVKSVRNIDRAAIESAGIAGYSLMCRAGLYAYQQIVREYPQAKQWQIVCGGGNNGGDGYVVARLAAEEGISVSVLSLASPDELKGDAKQAYSDYTAIGGTTTDYNGELDTNADVLIDALLGTGLERSLSGNYSVVVDAINLHHAVVVSLDVPSGLHGDTGRVLGNAVVADTTVTFVGLKTGLFLNDAPMHVGSLLFSDLDVPASCREAENAVLQRIDSVLLDQMLPQRPLNSHKGDFGRLLIVGGAPGMPGAVQICGEAALRAGAGAVTVATHPSHSSAIPAHRPELMCCAVETEVDLQPLLKVADVVAIGPGLGTGNWSRNLLQAVLSTAKPVVIDADGLNLLANGQSLPEHSILTPHPGEAARLLGTSAANVQADRLSALSNLSKNYSGTIVLKGAGTLVLASSETPWLCTAGNPGMAAPGMGDALTGIIAAMLCQGLAEEMAAVVGVQVHAEAGDAAARSGERGLLVSDLLAEVRGVVNRDPSNVANPS